MRALINPLQVGAMRTYARALRREGYLNSPRETDISKTRHFLHDEVVGRFFHLNMVELVSRMTGIESKASFSGLSHYLPGSLLTAHRDRPQCRLNVSLAVDNNRGLGKAGEWPLFIEYRGKAHRIILQPGDGVIYSGHKSHHWRNAQPQGMVTSLYLLCFVDRGFGGALT